MYCLVSTFNKTFDEIGLLYFIPDFLQKNIKKGKIVEVPVWTKIEIAIVLDIWDLKSLNILDIDQNKIKSIVSIKNNDIFLNDIQIKLVKFISKFYFTHIHKSISLFFPKNLKEKIIKEKIVLKDSSSKNNSNIQNKDDKTLEYSFNSKKKLNLKQNKVFEEIIKSKKNKFLLHWVTWSWKTEIYIKLIQNQLNLGKQSLLLIPEIILTNQLEVRLKEVFWENVITINSSITEASKTKAWVSIYSKEAKIIIGTRSALFYPYNNLGLIIVDEEHDSSYISDNSPRYKVIDVVEKLTELNWNKLLLASWTPSIESMYKAVRNEYNLINLLEKFE